MRETAACLRDLVEARALSHPDARAVGRDGVGWLTTGQLDRAAGDLAGRLARQGVGPGDVVGLLLPRSVEFVVAVLAVWKAGAAYTPLDPNAPEQHRAFVLDNSGVRTVITDDEAAGRATGRRVCLVGDLEWARSVAAADFASVPLAPADPAWVLYTSGSTGRPKGVIGSHGASLDRCRWMWREQPFDELDVCVQNTAPSVVDSVWEVWGALAQGVPVTVPPAHASLDLDLLVQILSENAVTRICLVPSLLRALLGALADLGDRLPRLKTWTCSGETLDRDLATAFHTTMPGRRLLNQYGLTESCADVTTYDTADLADGADDARVPVGRPIRDTRIVVVDEELRPVADGEVGELLLGGPALANGYANAPELTNDRFLADVLGDGVTFFRTGDLVRKTTDGVLHHLGRRDRQVKIRGFRVEPEGVEAVLKECPGVGDAAVRVWSRGEEPELAAYVVPGTPAGAPDVGELRARMLDHLPSHAIPASFTVLPAFPRTASGKVDYKLLPEPDRRPARSGTEGPRDATEEAVAAIWREVLGTGRVGLRDDFYELGGHSLALMRVIAHVNAEFAVRLWVRDLSPSLTVESLAHAVRRTAGRAEDDGAADTAERTSTGIDLASHTQEAMWLHEKFSQAPGLYNIQLAFRVHGPLDTRALAEALDDVVTRHRALRIGFEHRDGALRLRERAPGACSVKPDIVETTADRIGTLLADEGARPFDLAQGALLRALLLRTDEDTHVLSLTVHHTVCDGQSLRPLLASLRAAYASRLAGEVPRVRASRSPVAVPETRTRQPARRYPPLQLPTDRPRPRRADGLGASFRIDLPAGLAARVREQARRLRTTSFTVACAVFATVLAEWTGRRRFAISIPVSGRGPETGDDVVGCFMRTVPLHVDVPAGADLAELVTGVREAVHQAYDAPSATRLADGERPPLVMLAYDEAHGADFSLHGTRVVPLDVRSRSSKVDVTLYLDEAGDDYDCRIEYATALFAEDTLRHLGKDFQAALDRCCDGSATTGLTHSTH
ncbi:amino acid adenylation domain-containing protein [Kitasatospora sp. NPDC052896]|uniref:amino acid adenylation domain-containing protein n=1 Tax=Kitasatospora sp. NPDC052896 TaxID=3364061 RepID=UPI0037C961A4